MRDCLIKKKTQFLQTILKSIIHSVVFVRKLQNTVEIWNF